MIVLSDRPGKIKRELKINLPRPRRQKMIAEPDFGNLVRELLVESGVDADIY